MMEIAVYGSGYVGLVVAACLSDAGFSVHCVENNPQRLTKLKAVQLAGESAGLAELVEKNLRAGRLHFTGEPKEANCGIVFVCVGTPACDSGEADLSAVYAVLDSVQAQAEQDCFVFVKSTVPPGTCTALQQRADTAAEGARLEIISNPEFLREGSAVTDFQHPERVVVGAVSERARDLARAVYGKLHGNCDRLQLVSPTSAELGKYGSNAMLATRIAMINDMAIIAEREGADIAEVSRIVGSDHRLGPHFLSAGAGFGGSCFGKDLQALDAVSSEYLESGLFRSVLTANRQHQLHCIGQLKELLGEDLSAKRGALWGLAFKPGIADTRNSSALAIAEAMQREGIALAAFDPGVRELPEPPCELAHIALADSAKQAAEGADFVVICTAWPQFAEVDLTALHRALAQPILIDTCNLLDPALPPRHGFHYRSMGRQSV